MLYKIKMVKYSSDEIEPNSKTKLNKIENKELEKESLYKSTIGKIKAILSLRN
jgi:hypothetical protein